MIHDNAPICLALKLASPRSARRSNGFDASEDSGDMDEVWSIAFENV